ncbi:hypothetical protein [Piscinibacter sp. XHJ-5]|uniref:hypothetical protein n=1 Tax=Piscinibacter sp. XHJ-5 TaxID=3037797 RepID=UPI0024535FF9|nr:hypothetical protein [Piscinibacter sp. XHJ-5]
MASDAREILPSGSVPHTEAALVDASPSTIDSTATDVLNAMGYEAADPALHAPLWAEAMADAERRSLR